MGNFGTGISHIAVSNEKTPGETEAGVPVRQEASQEGRYAGWRSGQATEGRKNSSSGTGNRDAPSQQSNDVSCEADAPGPR